MGLHAILTEHPGTAASRERVVQLQAALGEATTSYGAAKARWRTEKAAALASADPLPARPSDPTVELRWQLSRERDGARNRATEIMKTQADELRGALAAREREIFAQIPALAGPLRALAEELMCLGHTAMQVDRANDVYLSKAAAHAIGLDEAVAAAAEGTSFLGLGPEFSDVAEPAHRPEGRGVTFKVGGRDVTEGHARWRQS